MLIKSILSDEPCVKVRRGMIVVVSEAYYHCFVDNTIAKVENYDRGGEPCDQFVNCNTGYLMQFISPEHLRIASKSEKTLYRKQLKSK